MLSPNHVSMNIPYFEANQDPKRDRPKKYVSIEEARELKKAKTHFFVNHGSAIAEVPQVAFAAAARQRESKHFDVDGRRIRTRGNWLIVGQTAIPGTEKFRNQPGDGPGMPHYSFV